MIFKILIIFFLNRVEANFEIKELNHLIEIGAKQYQILETKQAIPHYGVCWKDALKNLEKGCRGLSEKSQQKIAIELTDCFLEMSGHEKYNCDKLGFPMNKCLQSMSDRAFNAYTEFYTHSHNICFFFQSHFWHEEIEQMVNRLSSSSILVTKQLEHAEFTQNLLLNHQKNSLHVQNELLNNALNLNKIMNEYKTSTNEQKQMLFDVFERLMSLQSWILGEIALVETLFVYFISTLVVFFLTATPHTLNARVPLFCIISINAFLEYLICKFCISNYNLETYNIKRELFIWSCRRITAFICLMLLILSLFSYRDYFKLNHNLLIKIYEQNFKILNSLEQILKTKLASYNLENEINNKNTTPSSSNNNSPLPTPKLFLNNYKISQRKIDFNLKYSLRSQKDKM